MTSVVACGGNQSMKGRYRTRVEKTAFSVQSPSSSVPPSLQIRPAIRRINMIFFLSSMHQLRKSFNGQVSKNNGDRAVLGALSIELEKEGWYYYIHYWL